MSSLRDRWGYLPAPMTRLLEATGDEDLLLRVVARAGGRRMRVPVRLTERTTLFKVLGDDARTVWGVFRADHETWVTIPVMMSFLARARARRLLSLIETGVTVQEAACRCGMTERGAYYALARTRRKDTQRDLFRRDLFRPDPFQDNTDAGQSVS